MRLLHSEKALLPIVVTDAGRSTLCRELQALKAMLLIDSRALPSAKVTAARDWQPPKAVEPIVVRDTGRSIRVRALQPLNDYFHEIVEVEELAKALMKEDIPDEPAPEMVKAPTQDFMW